jgi:hypothetical protein
MDWAAWHADYDNDTPLRRRLEIVQRHIGNVLDAQMETSPLQVVSMCAGEARDLLGAVARGDRRDLRGRLVELDQALAAIARSGAAALGLDGIEVVVGDAGHTRAYAGAVPADLVLACGVFGNITDEDIERTVRALPSMCRPGATVIWTRHRNPPDVTSAIRSWLVESGFVEVAFDPVPDSPASVGVARYAGQAQPFSEHDLFTFTRTALG